MSVARRLTHRPALCLAMLLAAAGLSRGQEASGFVLGFEEQVPGQIPAGWTVGWGEIGDDLCRVTNLHAAEGEQAMLLDRLHGTNPEPVKIVRTIPDIPDGWAELSFCMFVDGRAADVAFTVEIGPTHPRQLAKVVVGLRGWGPDIYLYPNTLPTWSENWEAKTVMASYEPRVWYRVTLWLPTRGGGQQRGHGMVERVADEGWERVGTVQSIPCSPPEAPWEHLSIIVNRNQRDFELFLDAFRLTSREELPDF